MPRKEPPTINELQRRAQRIRSQSMATIAAEAPGLLADFIDRYEFDRNPRARPAKPKK